MSRLKSILLPATFGAAMLLTAASGAMAQEGGEFIGGVSKGMTPSCPAIELHIRPVAPTGAVTISGVAYFSDMSGISRVEGTRNADGAISGHLTSVWGKGPTGNYGGQRTGAKLHVELNGAGCSKGALDLNFNPQMYTSPG